MQHQLVTTPVRPSRAQIEPAALELLSRHSAGLLATAQRYSACPQDAEDAYQRGVEILLTKAPTTSEDELLPWLKVVVKHEAYAVRKSRVASLPIDEELLGEPDAGAWTDERAERYEQLRIGAEAIAGLKPQEIRCLLLKAEGLSYREIAEATGFSYTKVNRCLTEGRRAFMQHVARIESGAECERLAPLISRVADGEASAEEMRAVRPHLKSCLACKATLREYRATPSRIAGLVPPVVALAGGGDGTIGFFGRLLQRVADAHDAAGAKLAAVAASAVVVAGGGAAGIQTLHHDEPPARAVSAIDGEGSAAVRSIAVPAPSAGSPAGSSPVPAPEPAHPALPAVERAATTTANSSPAAASTTSARAADPAPEFDPGIGSATAADEEPAEFGTVSPLGAGAPSAAGASPSAPASSTPAESGGLSEFGP